MDSKWQLGLGSDLEQKLLRFTCLGRTGRGVSTGTMYSVCGVLLEGCLQQMKDGNKLRG